MNRLDDSHLNLEVRDTGIKGKGVFTKEPINKGDYVAEYSGDLVTMEEAQRREKIYSSDDSKGSYMYYFKWRTENKCVDATNDNGRLGRIINHSKTSANLKSEVFTHNEKPHLVFFAKSDIQKGQELLFDYGDRSKESIKKFPWLAK